MKHPHAEVIKAWADGKAIQYWHEGKKEWIDIYHPRWIDGCDYRVKPGEVVDYTVVSDSGVPGMYFHSNTAISAEFYSKATICGFLKRTSIDGKVVAMEFVPK